MADFTRFFRAKSVRSLAFLALLVAAPLPALARRRHKQPPPAPVTPTDLALLPEPKPNEVCFSPEEPCGAKLVKFVLGAKKSLDLAIYDINLDQLVHSLAVASKRIPVRIIVDQRQSKGEHSLVGLLVKAGVNVRYGRQRGIMHNKFILRDGQTLETGSFNFTNHATLANNENQIYLDTPEIVSRYAKHYDKIWAEAEPVTAPDSSANSSNHAADGESWTD